MLHLIRKLLHNYFCIRLIPLDQGIWCPNQQTCHVAVDTKYTKYLINYIWHKRYQIWFRWLFDLGGKRSETGVNLFYQMKEGQALFVLGWWADMKCCTGYQKRLISQTIFGAKDAALDTTTAFSDLYLGQKKWNWSSGSKHFLYYVNPLDPKHFGCPEFANFEQVYHVALDTKNVSSHWLYLVQKKQNIKIFPSIKWGHTHYPWGEALYIESIFWCLLTTSILYRTPKMPWRTYLS